MDLLRPRLAASALDLPGHGGSPPRTDGKYSISALARTVIDLIDRQRTGPVHLIGNSMGGAVALRAAAKRPDLVRSLTLVAPALPDSRLRMDLIRFPVVSIPKVGAFLVGKYLAFPPEQRVADTLRACYFDMEKITKERYEIEVTALREQDAKPYAVGALIGCMRALTAEQMFRPGPLSPWREARRITVPVLVTYGTHDTLVSARMAGRARKAFPDGHIRVLENSGHVAQMEYPETLAKLIGTMLDGNERTGPAVVQDVRTTMRS